jgi:hypothetical protein
MARAAPLLLALGVAGLVLAPAPVLAQAKKPAPAMPTKAQLERAAANLRVYVGALQSDKVPEVVKTVLFTCVYSNAFSKISEGTDKALAAKKVSNTDPNMVLAAMAAVCGYRPGQMGKPATAPKK